MRRDYTRVASNAAFRRSRGIVDLLPLKTHPRLTPTLSGYNRVGFSKEDHF
jgi:hypothetical protein